MSNNSYSQLSKEELLRLLQEQQKAFASQDKIIKNLRTQVSIGIKENKTLESMANTLELENKAQRISLEAYNDVYTNTFVYINENQRSFLNMLEYLPAASYEASSLNNFLQKLLVQHVSTYAK